MILGYVPAQHGNHYQVVLIFGVGLIGRAIYDGLKGVKGVAFQEFPVSWLAAGERESQLLDIKHAMSCLNSFCPPARVDVVWSAGKSGFSSDEQDLASELVAFQDVLEFSSFLKAEYSSALFFFHHISSAGGLFEGSRFVDSATPPTPRRGYGCLKLKQEDLLQDRLCKEYEILIYRPSTVYGFAMMANRKGLVSTLIYAALKNQVVNLYGRSDTLRDYVYCDDIARFVVDKILAYLPSGETFFLASGKPTALDEVLKIVEDVLMRKIYLKYQQLALNAEHNTFNKNLLPKGWNPVDLRTGIFITFMKTKSYLSYGVTG